MEKGILEKKDEANNIENNNITKTIIIGLVGMVLFLLPNTLNKVIGVIVGTTLLIVGGVSIYKYIQKKDDSGLNLVSGILYAVLGMIIILYPRSVLNLVAKCLGVYLLISGTMKLKVALALRNVNTKWIGTLTVSILILVLGALLIFNPFAGIEVTKLSGAFLVIMTVFDLIDIYIIQK